MNTPPHSEAVQQALADLRHLYLQLTSGAVQDAHQARSVALGLLGPALVTLETLCGQAAPSDAATAARPARPPA